MREIKFRAWLKETKEMIPVYQIDFNNGIINSESAWRMESEYILEQFTGLYDKNGVEIFEGDIVLHQFGVGYSSKMYASFADGTQRKQAKTIVWNKIYCGYDFLSPPYDDEWLQDFEVIGNIHDNPELLGGGTC